MVFSIAVCVLSLSYAFYNWALFPLGDRPTLYIWHSSASTVPVVAGLCLFPLMFIVAAAGFRARWLDGSFFTISAVLIALFLGNAAACIAALPVAFERRQTLDQVDAGEQRYRLEQSTKPGVGSAGRLLVVLWQCDSLGWVCRIIHRIERAPIPDAATIADEETSTAVLQYIPGESQIALIIDGRVVYEHPLD